MEHADSMHLYYNMASFAWKGIILESVLGAPFFAYMLVVFSILTGLLSVAIYYALALLISPEFMFSCGVGFSGVIFALKVYTFLNIEKLNHIYCLPNYHAVLLLTTRAMCNVQHATMSVLPNCYPYHEL